MTHFYIMADNEKGFEEITEKNWKRIIGEPPVSGYAIEVYQGIKTIEKIPEEYREETKKVVEAKIEKWGLYKDTKISDSEFTEMVEGVL